MDIWVVSTFYPLWKMNNDALTVVYKFLCRHVFTSERFLKVELLACIVILCLTYWKGIKTVFPSDCTILHSHKQYVRVLNSPYPC